MSIQFRSIKNELDIHSTGLRRGRKSCCAGNFISGSILHKLACRFIKHLSGQQIGVPLNDLFIRNRVPDLHHVLRVKEFSSVFGVGCMSGNLRRLDCYGLFRILNVLVRCNGDIAADGNMIEFLERDKLHTRNLSCIEGEGHIYRAFRCRRSKGCRSDNVCSVIVLCRLLRVPIHHLPLQNVLMSGSEMLIGHRIHDRYSDGGVNNLHISIRVDGGSFNFGCEEGYGLVRVRNALVGCHLYTVTMQRIIYNYSISSNKRSIECKGQHGRALKVVTANKCVRSGYFSTGAIQKRFASRLQNQITIHRIGFAGNDIGTGHRILNCHRRQGFQCFLPCCALSYSLDLRRYRRVCHLHNDNLVPVFHGCAFKGNVECNGC